jgi:hypothetical protein
MTGYCFENLIYSKFKGFHFNLHALKLKTEEGEIKIRGESSGLFLGLFNPELPELCTPGTKPILLKGDLSFFYKIILIGTNVSEYIGDGTPRSESAGNGTSVRYWIFNDSLV